MNETINNIPQKEGPIIVTDVNRKNFKVAVTAFFVNFCFLPALFVVWDIIGNFSDKGLAGFLAGFFLIAIGFWFVNLPIALIAASLYYYFSNNKKSINLLKKINLILFFLLCVGLLFWKLFYVDYVNRIN